MVVEPASTPMYARPADTGRSRLIHSVSLIAATSDIPASALFA